MKDKFGQELKIGDTVIYSPSGIRTLEIGTVTNIDFGMCSIDSTFKRNSNGVIKWQNME